MPYWALAVLANLALLCSCSTQRFAVGESKTRTIEIRVETLNKRVPRAYELLDVVNVEPGTFLVAHRNIQVSLQVSLTGVTANTLLRPSYCLNGDLVQVESPNPVIANGVGGERDIVTIPTPKERRVGECVYPPSLPPTSSASLSMATSSMTGAGMTSLSTIVAAFLTVTSVPSGAEVFLDGKHIGSTLVKYTQPYSGSHVFGIEWRKDGFITCLRKVNPTFLMNIDCALRPIN